MRYKIKFHFLIKSITTAMKKMQQIFAESFGLVLAFALIVGISACGSEGGQSAEGAAADAAAEQPVQPANAQEPAAPAAAPTAEATGPLTTIEFDNIEHDFGTITQGDVVDHVFKFTNTGDEPLVIKNAKGSCGCTVPQWPKEPIAPGEGGEIKVEFKSAGKSGIQSKKVTIDANVPGGKTFLTIKSNVEKKETPVQ